MLAEKQGHAGTKTPKQYPGLAAGDMKAELAILFRYVLNIQIHSNTFKYIQIHSNTRALCSPSAYGAAGSLGPPAISRLRD